MNQHSYDAIVIGGGIYGCALASRLRAKFKHVILLEKEADLFRRASYTNQARVHHGYHYPRSVLTALRSRANFDRFIREFSESISDDFQMYYAVGKVLSKVTASQFVRFCQRIGAPIRPAPAKVKKLFNTNLIEEVFSVTEYAFDAVKLKERFVTDLLRNEIKIQLKSAALQVKSTHNGVLEVCFETENRVDSIVGQMVYNCTYSQINRLLASSNLNTIPLKHELTELVIVDVPDFLRRCGITVMCGPFFSVMPFPPLGLHTLSHVRYTPHCSWEDESLSERTNSVEFLAKTKQDSNFSYMIRDAARYVPSLRECLYVNSLWEVKTVLPSSEVDDSRPILFKKHADLPNLTSVMGGKIDNIYDLLDELDRIA